MPKNCLESSGEFLTRCFFNVVEIFQKCILQNTFVNLNAQKLREFGRFTEITSYDVMYILSNIDRSSKVAVQKF